MAMDATAQPAVATNINSAPRQRRAMPLPTLTTEGWEESRMAKELHIVGFRIGRETFGVPISLVHEIVRVPDITSVPEAPDYVEGVINLRGKIISVVDLRKRFGETEIKTHKKNRILVVEVSGKLVGLMVDAASEVLKIPPSEIDLPPNVFEEGELNYVTGVGKLQSRLIILIDLTKILQKGELRRLEEFQEHQSAAASA
jgi:purine-binding chemotaxis protein CheW